MDDISKIEEELKVLVVEALMLDDVKAEEIDSEESLFVDGLGLDSIDALELAIAIEKRYAVKIKANDDEKRKIFGSVRTLAQYVASHAAAE